MDSDDGRPRWTVGRVAITAVPERVNEVPVEDFIPAAAAVAGAGDREWLRPWALDDGRLRFAIQSFAIEADGRKILVDTCIGARPLPAPYEDLSGDGSYLEGLTAAGFGRDDVDLVICTHLHFDHVGWNTVAEEGRWVPTFRRARYLIVREEYEHWQSVPEAERLTSNLLTFDDAVVPLFAAGVADLVPTDCRVSDSVRLVPTPGHTQGHVSVSVTSEGEQALITGDCAHSPVQLEDPAWSSVADADPAAATATRHRLARDYADTSVLILGTHFPLPTAGYLVTTGHGVRFRAEGESYSPPG